MFVPQLNNNGEIGSFVGNMEDLCNMMKSGILQEENLNLEKKKVDIFADDFVKFIVESLKEYDEYKIDGLGVFTVRPEDRYELYENIDPKKIIVTIKTEDLDFSGGLF